MPHGPAAAAFQKIDKAQDIALHIGVGIFQRVAHSRLSRQIDDDLEIPPANSPASPSLSSRLSREKKKAGNIPLPVSPP